MPKISLAGFKDPVRRPRFIIWTGVAVLVLAAVMIVALGVTSTRWFCAEGCHKVQDDTILAYERSSHSNISCMACHMPVNANPVVFILHKAEALGELYLTVTDQFELPLNAHSHVALTMTSTQCVQCHNMKTRPVTPSAGIKIDHAAHAEVNAACTVCHNRVAHVEDFDLTLLNPANNEPNKKHASFMSMSACFRCHSQAQGAAAPGTCSACHPADFQLKPPSHLQADFFPVKHGEMAQEAQAEVLAAENEGEGEGETEVEGEGEEKSEEGTGTSWLGPEKAYASGGAEVEKVSAEEVPELLATQKEHGADPNSSVGGSLPSVESIFECGTCHAQTFCDGCHGMEIPHPAEFKEPKDAKDPNGHPVISAAKGDKCVMCHTKADPEFCNSCHHGKEAGGWEFKTAEPWTAKQHPQAVAAGGVKACTEKCHTPKYCVDCHTGKKIVPSSHREQFWTKPKAPGAVTTYQNGQAQPAVPTAKHSTAAQQSMEQCEVCHGPGGATAPFCKGCHKLEMPHPAQFKEQHVSSKKNQAACTNCHLFKEVCSNCHHADASLTVPWAKVHGGSVNKNGAAGCVEKCHTKDDCVKCHTARKVVPNSHKSKAFVRDFSNKDAIHVQLYTKDGEICTYCHAGQAAELPNSTFCTRCHKVQMPHPSGFAPAEGEKPTKDNGGQHAELFKTKKTTKAVCSNCHQTAFCDNCHHKGTVPSRPWVRQHPNIVKKEGANPCFDCHQPTFCANCHVNLAKRGLL